MSSSSRLFQWLQDYPPFYFTHTPLILPTWVWIDLSSSRRITFIAELIHELCFSLVVIYIDEFSRCAQILFSTPHQVLFYPYSNSFCFGLKVVQQLNNGFRRGRRFIRRFSLFLIEFGWPTIYPWPPICGRLFIIEQLLYYLLPINIIRLSL